MYYVVHDIKTLASVFSETKSITKKQMKKCIAEIQGPGRI